MESISVLVVDDEPGIALLCNRVLSRAGYDVLSETNPRTAIELLQQKRFDLLVVDIRMPEVDGFDVISRAQMIQPDIAVLVMTGFGTVETAIRALRQGVDGLLLKPFQKSDELLQAVRQAMTDNQRKRDTARVSALRPLFNVTERLFAETDRDRLLDLIVSAVCEHLNCSNVAYYEVKNGNVSVVAQRGKVLQVDAATDDSNFAAQLISHVDADGNPFVVNATGPGEEDAQALLSSLRLNTAILIPVARSNLHSVLFAARDATGTDRPFRGADLEMFFVLARQAVVAMENASLYEDLRDYVRKVEDSQQALLRAEKMAAAGRLTASIAHEVNNPLQSVQNCLHLAAKGIFRSCADRARAPDEDHAAHARLLPPWRGEGGACGYFGITAACVKSHFAAVGSTSHRSAGRSARVASTDLCGQQPDPANIFQPDPELAGRHAWRWHIDDSGAGV